MSNTNNLSISIGDWLRGIKTYYKQIILLCSLISIISFIFFTKNYIYFSAYTTFQATTSPIEAKKMDFISSTLSFLSGQQNNSNEDPFIIKKCNKILTNIVQSTNLQAEIPNNKPNYFKRILNNIQLETAFYNWRRPKELIHLSKKNIYIPKIIFNNESNFFSQCSHVEYCGEILKKLNITVFSNGDFLVFDTFSKSCLGKGSIGKTFFFSEGSFKITINALPRKQKSFSLILIPLQQTIEILKENLKITRDPSSHTLFNIQYKHINRHQAKLVLEKTLLFFKKFLQEEEQNKILKEKHFFNEKEQEVFQLIQKELDHQKLSISQELSDIELTAFISCQSYLKNINNLRQQLKELERDLYFSKNSPYLKFPIKSSFYSEKISSYLLEKENLESQENNYHFYLNSLKENPERSLFSLLEKYELNPHVNRITNLDYDLFKQRNWSETEITRLKNEIQQEKNFLEKKIENLIDSSKVKIQAINRQLNYLNEQIIQELINKKSFLKKELNENITELKKIICNKIDQEFKETKLTLLFKQLEFFEKAKHNALLSHSMNYLTSPTLPKIIIPNLPNHPHLIMKVSFVFFGNFLFMIFCLLIKESLLSPSINKNNLLLYKRNYLGNFSIKNISYPYLNQLKEQETTSISKLLEFLPNTPTIIEIGSHTYSPISQFLATILKARNKKKILVIDIKTKISPLDLFEDQAWNIHSKHDVDYLEISKLSLYKSIYQQLLCKYYYIIINYEINQPSDQLSFSLTQFHNIRIFHIANERLNFILQLHPLTLFISGLEPKIQLNLTSIIGNCLLEGSLKWTSIKKAHILSNFIKKESFARIFLSKGAKEEPL